MVKSVRIVRDRSTGVSRGVAFVDFPSVSYASHSLQQATALPLVIDKTPVKISYAKEAVAMTLTSLPVRKSIFVLLFSICYYVSNHLFTSWNIHAASRLLKMCSY